MGAKGLGKLLRTSWHMISVGKNWCLRRKGTGSDDGLGFLTASGTLCAVCLHNLAFVGAVLADPLTVPTRRQKSCKHALRHADKSEILDR